MANEISFDNGRSFIGAEDMSDEQVGLVLLHLEHAAWDNGLREELHSVMALCPPREFVETYVRKHRAKYGEPIVIG